jgi:hypothetical protein
LPIVPSLTGSQDHRHRQATPIDRKVDLPDQPAAGPSEAFPFDREASTHQVVQAIGRQATESDETFSVRTVSHAPVP